MKSRDTVENTPSKLTARALGAPLDTTTSRPCALPLLLLLLLLWRRGVEFGHFLLNSLAEANPQGCQRVAGGRSGKGGNDHRKAASESEHPGRGARAAPWSARAGSKAGLAPLPGCRTSPAPLPGGRRPHNPRRPPATLWQPFRLTKPECPNFTLLLSARRRASNWRTRMSALLWLRLCRAAFIKPSRFFEGFRRTAWL